MPDRHLESDSATHAVAHDIGLLDPEMTQQCRRIVGHLLVRDRAVDVGGVAVALLLDGDHLPRLAARPGRIASMRSIVM